MTEREVSKSARPSLPINQDTAFWLAGARAGQLLIQRCASCGELRHPPAPMCGTCHSLEWDTMASAGRGHIFSFVVHHFPHLPGFPSPNPILLIALDEGVRMLGSPDGISPAELEIGLRVEAVFPPGGSANPLPSWRAVREG